MRSSMKFGRRIPAPSMVQIKHDLRVMTMLDDLGASLQEKNLAPGEVAQIIADLVEAHGISPQQAQAVSSRIGAAQSSSATAALAR